MRLKSLFALVSGLMFAGALAAQAQPATPSPAVPPPLEAENTLHLDLSTGGRVTVQLRPDLAPNHVERIKTLARQGFYNGVVFHRVIEGFMAQTGDPTGTGTGGSPLPDLAAEFNTLPHVRGAVAAARASDVNSANSQFYIMLAPRLSLDNKYTVFGRVISGMAFVDSIERGEPPANPSRILRASVGADNVAPPRPGEVVPAAPQPPAASAAASAADAAVTQSIDAAVSASSAAQAAKEGDTATAAEQARAASVAAEGATEAAKDAAEAAEQADKPKP